MKLLPFGRMLPVHCCCEPSRRLGWVPCRRQERGPIRFLLGLPSYDIETGVVTSPEMLTTTIEELIDGDERFLAVKSAERPVDDWRKVPGFIEDRRL